MPPMKGQFQFRHEYVYIVLFKGYVHSAWRTKAAATKQRSKLLKGMGRKGAKIMGLTWVRQEVLD